MKRSMIQKNMMSRHADAGRRGTILILVVVMLALMALMGVAYLQISRVTREATKDVGGDIDVVADSVLQLLLQQAAQDVFAPSGDQFDATAGVEPYDYAGNAINWGGTSGSMDDLWLASTAPTTGGQWPHISNLTGKYIQGWDNAQVKFGTGSPTDANMTQVEDTNQLYSDNELVDASGDGVGDSRWFFPPIKAIRGIEYAAALYVVDNGSKLNANVALSQVSTGGAYTTGAANAPNAPQWWYPVELDLGRFAYGFTTTNMTQVQTFLRWRLGSTTAQVMPTRWFNGNADPLARSFFWFNGARTWGNINSGTPASVYRSLSWTDELELRYGNGLNTATEAQIETTTGGMPVLLRHSATAETSWSAVTGPTLANWYLNDPRKQLTVFNGAGIFAPRLPGDPAGRILKADLNRLAVEANKARLAAEVLKIINAGTTSMALPTGFTAADYADQIAANIIDYVDNDVPSDPDATLQAIGGNTLTKVGNRWGFEGLPFIAEVYVQRQYTAEVVQPANTVTWAVQPSVANNKAGFAIEIRNPLPRRIDLRNVTFMVGGTSWGTLDTLIPGSFGKVYLNAYEGIILYRNSTPTDGTRSDITQLFSAAGATPLIPAGNRMVIATTNDWPTTDGPIAIELRAKDEAGDDVRYQTLDSYGMANTKAPAVITSATPVVGAEVRYRQYATIGNGNKLNVLTVTDSGGGSVFTKNDVDPRDDNATTQAYDGTNVERLALNNKSAGTGAGPTDQLTTTNNEQIVISNFGQFGQVGELGHLAFLGPRDTGSGANTAETIPDRWGTQTSAANFMLDFQAATKIDGSVDALNVPHAMMFFDRFTTMAPTASFTGDPGDGVDNDGDGQIDEADEQLVPGMVNINTVTVEFLAKVLPINDATLRNNVATEIINYRDNVAGRPAGSRTSPGIAHMGELVPVLQLALTSGSYAIDTSAIGGVWVDMIGQNMDPTALADGVIDDREEQVMLARFLNQVASTRSDVFTAYITVRGFQAGAFDQDPIEAARYIVVFDRSGMTSNSDRPRIIGYQRVY